MNLKYRNTCSQDILAKAFLKLATTIEWRKALKDIEIAIVGAGYVEHNLYSLGREKRGSNGVIDINYGS
jgi:hypothetical protein